MVSSDHTAVVGAYQRAPPRAHPAAPDLRRIRLSIGNCITGKFNKIIGNLVPVTHFDIGYRSITHFDIEKLSIPKMCYCY